MEKSSKTSVWLDRLRDAMDGFRGQSRPTLLVIAVAFVLIPALAVLQYRWIGQVSTAERERMNTTLRRAMMQMRNDADRAVTRAYEAFLLETRGGSPESLEERASRYDAWAESTPTRNLVKRFLISEDNGSGEPKLLAYAPDNMEFVPAEWPAEWKEFREPGFRGLMPRAANAIAARRICPDAQPDRNEPRRPGRTCGWAIAELNVEYAATHLLPPLVERYFGTDYYVEVAAESAPDKILFSSHAARLETPDLRESMLMPRPDLLWRDQRPRQNGKGRPPEPNFYARSQSLPPPPVPAFRPSEKRGNGPQPRPGLLEVRVKHHSGSVEASVERTRRLNLLVSLAILGVLAGCVVLLHRSASRERKLAQLQMDFIAGVSHELRTPLSAAKALSENLADGLVHSDPQVRYYGRLLRDQSQNLAEVVEQILRLAGIQSGRVNLHLQPVPLAEVLDRAVEAAGPDIEQAHRRLERDAQEPLPAVMADAASLTQCIRNLLSNAAKYGDRGAIKLCARRSPEPNSNQVWISVEDQGPGIEPREMRHLFKPFFRGRRAIDAQIHGLGLGLALVKRIVDAHSGNVEVLSKPGVGSRFTLRLPAAQTAD
ncbi:MAG: HAMP domain-containing histidine kinase [Acidobacteria bacterium]|nr:HAMP domain-containing histidine kinase [Acidobacteriota bacterium]